jgi:hypothetical protein
MAWQFEKVFNTTIPTTPKHMAFDGKFIWVTGVNNVYVYSYWEEGELRDVPFESIDDLDYNKFDGKLKLIETISVPNGSYWITRGYDKMWVSSGAIFDKITGISITTLEVTDNIVCPKMMASNLLYENSKLWMVNQFEEDVDRQKLFNLDINLIVWNSDEIQTRKQQALCYLATPYNGSIYVTNFNNVSIAKFSADTGLFERLIRVNAFPTTLLGTSDRELFVGSYEGVISSINTSDNLVSHPFSALDDINSMSIDGDYFWIVHSSGRLMRLNRSTRAAFISDKIDEYDLSPDWHLDLSKFLDATSTNSNFYQTLITPEYSYQSFNGTSWDTVTIKPYLFIIGLTSLNAFRLDKPIYRDGFIAVHGQAMVSTGAEDYMGEVG